MRRCCRLLILSISIHALREEGDCSFLMVVFPLRKFLSTPSARRATCRLFAYLTGKKFLSTPSARRATISPPSPLASMKYFYPRPPRGGRPKHHAKSGTDLGNFYPRPPRGGRLLEEKSKAEPNTISIHALREEGDESRRTSNNPNGRFLSTPSARRATVSASTSGAAALNFYPRPPRGGRQALGNSIAIPP